MPDLLDYNGRSLKTQGISVEDLRRGATERLQEVSSEVKRFFEQPDSNRQLRMFLASEFIFNWVEQGLGKTMDRPFNLEQQLERLLENEHLASLDGRK